MLVESSTVSLIVFLINLRFSYDSQLNLQPNLPKAGTMKSSHHGLGCRATLAAAPAPGALRFDMAQDCVESASWTNSRGKPRVGSFNELCGCLQLMRLTLDLQTVHDDHWVWHHDILQHAMPKVWSSLLTSANACNCMWPYDHKILRWHCLHVHGSKCMVVLLACACIKLHAATWSRRYGHERTHETDPIEQQSILFQSIKDFESFTWTLNQINWWSGTSVGTTSASESIVCMDMPCMQLHGVTWSRTLINDGIVCMYMHATSAECQITNGLIVLFACTCMQLHTAT